MLEKICRALRYNEKLYQAICNGKAEKAKKLIKRKVNPNWVSKTGDTFILALIKSLRINSFDDEMITAIIKKSNLDIKNYHGLTPLMIACMRKLRKFIPDPVKMSDFSLVNDSGAPPILLALKYQNHEANPYLIEGSDFNKKYLHGNTILKVRMLCFMRRVLLL